MRTWKLTDQEFQVICDLRCEEFMPSPLIFTSDIPGLTEYESYWEKTRRELTSRIDSDFEAMMDALARNDVAIGAQAWVDAEFTDPQRRVRLHAMRRGSRGYVIEQFPGRTLQHAGGFEISECQPRALGEAIVARLPNPGAAAGGRGPYAIDRGDGDAPRRARSSSMIRDDEDDDLDSGIAFWNTPAEHTGSVQVVQGRSKYGPRGITRSGVLWRDLPGDGRYVMPLHHPAPVAIGMSARGLADRINTEVQGILERMDDFGEVD